MLMRTDPFRDLDRLTQQVFGTDGTLARPSVMPMDAWRDGDTFHVEFDLPGVDPDSIDLDVERNVVTVKAERPARASDAELIAAERPRGVFSRQLILGDNLDTEHIAASYDGGVLTLRSRSPSRPSPARSRSPARVRTGTPSTPEPWPVTAMPKILQPDGFDDAAAPMSSSSTWCAPTRTCCGRSSTPSSPRNGPARPTGPASPRRPRRTGR